ncbi:MAG TPA: hypothetical protein PKZ16_02250 [bacterium]|nr:hypothetical protein [bacterium]HPL95569.1 hypothetical protein [bacterium]
MAKDKERKKGGGAEDSIGIILEQIGPPIAQVLVTFFSVNFLEKNLDIIKTSPFFSWIINMLLPDTGIGKTLADIQQEIFAKQLVIAVEAKIKNPRNFQDRSQIWQSLREKIAGLRASNPELPGVLEKIPDRLEKIGAKIQEWLGKNQPLEKINQGVGEWAMRQWGTKEKAPANLAEWKKKSEEFRKRYWRD